MLHKRAINAQPYVAFIACQQEAAFQQTSGLWKREAKKKQKQQRAKQKDREIASQATHATAQALVTCPPSQLRWLLGRVAHPYAGMPHPPQAARTCTPVHAHARAAAPAAQHIAVDAYPRAQRPPRIRPLPFAPARCKLGMSHEPSGKWQVIEAHGMAGSGATACLPDPRQTAQPRSAGSSRWLRRMGRICAPQPMFCP